MDLYYIMSYFCTSCCLKVEDSQSFLLTISLCADFQINTVSQNSVVKEMKHVKLGVASKTLFRCI